jgi:class 3 adenylate cyclase
MKDMKINEKILDEKLGELEKARAWSPRSISKLESLIRSGDEYSLFRINPLAFAGEKNISDQEAIDLFLYSSKFSIFDMNWNLVCPGCGGIIESFKSLRTLHSEFYCSLCFIETIASLDDYIQITFTISPEVREIIFHNPGQLSIEDYFLKYHFNREARYPGGPRFVDTFSEFVKVLSYLSPNEKRNFEFEAREGEIHAIELANNVNLSLKITGIKKDEAQTLPLKITEEKIIISEASLMPGKIIMEIDNSTNKRGKFGLANFPPMQADQPRTILDFGSFLSGKRLLTTQTFRDLFRLETIQGSEGIGVKDITILFTDLKGSTALYDRIGDLKAYTLIRQHFDSLGKVITNHDGAIVKTIGDAVMATFLNPLDAVKASLEMLKEIERFNQGLKSNDIILKIGIHRGASIAVTMNERQDYFGQTVNIASRVQNLADAEEIYISDEIYNFPGIKEILREYNLVSSQAKLKGVQDEMKVYKISFK